MATRRIKPNLEPHGYYNAGDHLERIAADALRACVGIPYLTRFRVRNRRRTVEVCMWMEGPNGRPVLETVVMRAQWWPRIAGWLRYRADLTRAGGHYYGND